MSESGAPRSRRSLRNLFLKGLFLYALAPALLLRFLAEPAGAAVRASVSAAFLIPLAALGAVSLNWLAYALIRRKRPPLPVIAYGIFLLLLVVLVGYEALPASDPTASTLALIAGCLALAVMFLLSYWLAGRRSKPAHVFAVGLWIAIGVTAFFMAYRVFRDIEGRCVSADTWITAGILVAVIPAALARRILSSRRASAFRRRASGLADGKILQLVGETRLDRDDDLVTDYHARVQYAVDGVSYETKAPIRKITMRRFGKQAFVGRKIPVHYNPDNPASAFTDPIDRHLFDHKDPSAEQEKQPE